MKFLFSKNKVGFVDGTIENPEKTHVDYILSICCDAMVKGWLTTTMERDIRGSVNTLIPLQTFGRTFKNDSERRVLLVPTNSSNHWHLPTRMGCLCQHTTPSSEPYGTRCKLCCPYPAALVVDASVTSPKT